VAYAFAYDHYELSVVVLQPFECCYGSGVRARVYSGYYNYVVSTWQIPSDAVNFSDQIRTGVFIIMIVELQQECLRTYIMCSLKVHTVRQ